MADVDNGRLARVTAQSLPTPDIIKTTNNPGEWDQLGGFAAVQAAEANAALALLDERLASAASTAERVAAFESAFRHVADWRHQVAVAGRWERPGAYPDSVRAPIVFSMRYRVTTADSDWEPRSPAVRMMEDLERTALDRLNGSDRLQNVVVLRDGRTINGNLLLWQDGEVRTETAVRTDREVLRRTAFEVLADLETKRAEAGRLDPHDQELRQEFADAAYCLVQAPAVQRGSDSIMRTFLVAAHTRVFDAAPVLPQGIDLDGMVRGQDGFNAVMRDKLKVITPTASAPAAGMGERAVDPRANTTRRPGQITR